MKPTTIVFMALIIGLTNECICWPGANDDLVSGGSLADCECDIKCIGIYCMCKTCNDEKSNLRIKNDFEDSNRIYYHIANCGISRRV